MKKRQRKPQSVPDSPKHSVKPVSTSARSSSLVRSRIAVRCVAIMAMIAAGAFSVSSRSVVKNDSPIAEMNAIPTLTELSAMQEDKLVEQDIAVLNLRAAEGLPGAEELDIAAITKQLDRWANRVRSETDRCLPQFFAKPEDFHDSNAYFRMLMLVTVLQQDFSVHYNPDRMHSIDFTRSQDLFIHGMIGSSNGGTCVSMPVLYASVARRLGYPVYLVNAKEHLFCRWDGQGEKLNIEGSSRGMNCYDDVHYRSWPHPIRQLEVDKGLYLKSLSASESFAVFVATRGHCLEDIGNRPEALACYAQAIKHSQSHPMYIEFKNRLARPKTIEDFPQILAQQDRLRATNESRSFAGAQQSIPPNRTNGVTSR